MIFVVTQKKAGKLLHTTRLCFNFNIQHNRRRYCIVDGSLAFETSWKKNCCLRFEWKALSSWRGRRKLPFDSISSRQPLLALTRCDDELELISFFPSVRLFTLKADKTSRVVLLCATGAVASTKSVFRCGG